MANRTRLWILALSAAAMLAVILVATGLRQVEFSPGYDLSSDREEDDSYLGAPGSLPDNTVLEYLYLALYFIGIPFVPFALIYLLLSSEGRRRLWRSLGLILWLLFIVFILRTRPDLIPTVEEPPPSEVVADQVGAPTLNFSATPPIWLVWSASAAVALLVAALFVGIAWIVWRRVRSPTPNPLDQVAQEAQRALSALKAGADLKDTVLRCYFEMSRVLSEERGLSRHSAMTPREFEVFLARAGLPLEHIHELTRLFEAVRYGAKVPAERQERQAIDCLAAIVEACESRP